eukprot:CAMPEP_0184493190 /NCGR_PEP_ID=MMETSP0113_2-20130426/25365_1 /TAXON_ID=91329 /ORGANISM="Norrisiella sphaerica, Strain BC52" /LENGTH=70 /DNA_ID=CAMNT_0026878377 /DNA_START=336 /DNA_END=548 /DNA_ORIENTATION=+
MALFAALTVVYVTKPPPEDLPSRYVNTSACSTSPTVRMWSFRSCHFTLQSKLPTKTDLLFPPPPDLLGLV